MRIRKSGGVEPPTPEPTYVTFTIEPTPEDANVVIVNKGITTNAATTQVDTAYPVTYSVTKGGYQTVTVSLDPVTEDTTIQVVLQPIEADTDSDSDSDSDTDTDTDSDTDTDTDTDSDTDTDVQ